MHRLTSTRRRRITSLTVAFVLLAAGSAAAYFLILSPGEGSSTQTLGKATNTGEHITLTATFAPGLTPGKHEPFTLKATNETKAATDIRFEHITVGIDAAHMTAACQTAWFKLVGDGFSKWDELTERGLATPIAVPKGQTVNIASGEGSEPESDPWTQA